MNEEKKTVHIPLGTNLNDGLPKPPQTEAEQHIPDFLPLPNDVFDDLPPLLRAACEQMQDPHEQETFLIGALGVLSGMLPKVQGHYFSRSVGANLYCFIIGRYGTGKGALLWAKELGEAIHQHRKAQAAQDIENYEQALQAHQQQQRLYDKGKLPEPPQAAPKPPNHLKLYLAANSTKTAVMQLLKENEGRGIIFETEGDTLADMLRQDYGNFSDVLRKAYHHEPISYYRRANNEDVEIDNPALSVVLSGTHDQLRRLIPSAENGLFSRFCFYILQGKRRFKNPFDRNSGDQQYYFGQLSQKLLQVYTTLEAREEPLYFSLQPHQEEEFVRTFDQQKEEIQEHISEDLEGTVNRMGLMTYRIAMILTCMRFADSMHHPTLTCLDGDFRNALAITRHLMHYSLHIYEQLETSKGKVEDLIAPLSDMSKKEQVAECCRQYKMGNTMEEIALNVLGRDTGASTVYRWIKKYCGAA